MDNFWESSGYGVFLFLLFSGLGVMFYLGTPEDSSETEMRMKFLSNPNITAEQSECFREIVAYKRRTGDKEFPKAGQVSEACQSLLQE